MSDQQAVFHGKPIVSKDVDIQVQIAAKRRGDRKNVFHGGALCSGCYDEEPLPGQRYGRKCHRKACNASYHKKQEELKRLRALEEQLQQLLKGQDDECASTDGQLPATSPGKAE